MVKNERKNIEPIIRLLSLLRKKDAFKGHIQRKTLKRTLFKNGHKLKCLGRIHFWECTSPYHIGSDLEKKRIN